MPWTPLRVPYIGLRHAISERTLESIWSEVRWVWIPVTLLGLGVIGVRRLIEGPAPATNDDRQEPSGGTEDLESKP